MEKAAQDNRDVNIDPPITIPAVKKDVEVQLHWSEYLQGEWSTRESSGFNAPSPIVKTELLSFDSKSVFIHVSKEPYEHGEERGVCIHLGGEINQAFYLAGRNSLPEPAPRESEPAMPYSKSGVRANRYSGSGSLTVEFNRRITTGLLETDATFTFLLASDNDLFVIKENKTGTNSTEVHVLSAASNYQQFILHTGTALQETDATFDFLLASNRDLFVIQKRNTGTNSTEVHVLSAASNYQQFSLHTGTTPARAAYSHSASVGKR